MSSSGDSVVSVNLQGKECSQPMVLHLMPCEINASGANKAKVDCYFTSTMKEDGPNAFRASFRGRPLHGACVTIPDNYTGVVLSKSEAVTGDEVLYNKTASFSSFYYWNLDKNVSQDDHAYQCIQWTRVSNAIHEKV